MRFYTLIFLFFSISLSAQITKRGNIDYVSGVPTHVPSSVDNKIAIDTTGKKIYLFAGGGWVQDKIDVSGQERSISITYANLATTTAVTLPTGQTVLQWLQMPLVLNEQPRTLTTRLTADMTLADVKTALGNTVGQIEFRNMSGVSTTDPATIPKGFYQITNQSTTGESWLFDQMSSDNVGSTGEYFDGGYLGQTNYSVGWSQLSLSSADSNMSGFSSSGNEVTCLVPGRYSVYASLSMGDIAQGQRGSGNGRLQIIIRKNGVNTKSEAWAQITSSNWQSQISTKGIVDLAAGDKIDVAVGAYSANAYTRSSKLVITKL